MRKLLLSLSALAIVGAGGAYLAQAQGPGTVGTRACYLDGKLCSDGANCCVTEGRCYNDCK